MSVSIARGDVWFVDFSPTRGREQSGTRPALVVSWNRFNKGPAELAVVVPMTSTARGVPLHMEVNPPEGGITLRSFIKCEDIRAVAKERFQRRCGSVSPQTMAVVEDRLRTLLEL